jgi:hypothetical protein
MFIFCVISDLMFLLRKTCKDSFKMNLSVFLFEIISFIPFIREYNKLATQIKNLGAMAKQIPHNCMLCLHFLTCLIKYLLNKQ